MEIEAMADGENWGEFISMVEGRHAKDLLPKTIRIRLNKQMIWHHSVPLYGMKTIFITLSHIK